MSEHLLEVTDGTFDTEVLQSPIPVLVDFWAEWCGPCRMVAPLLNEASAKYAGKFKFVKLDIEANPLTPSKCGIRGVPTFMVYKNGKLAATKVGAMNRDQLSVFIDSHL